MICPPVMVDIGSDADAGFWLAALPFARSSVSDFECRDDAPAGRPDGDRLTGSVRSFHDLRTNTEAQHHHG